MRTYLYTIKLLQTFFLSISILVMLILPIILVFVPEVITEERILNLYDISHIAIFFVMFIRPLADIVTEALWIRPLVILRKGVGVLSASIVVSFIFSKIIMDPYGYLNAFLTPDYWSIENYALLAHVADISAIILLVTSNNFSKKILGMFWKKIQKLSYVFFYASSLYVYLMFNDIHLLVSMSIITTMTLLAYIRNRYRVPPVQIPKTRTI